MSFLQRFTRLRCVKSQHLFFGNGLILVFKNIDRETNDVPLIEYLMHFKLKQIAKKCDFTFVFEHAHLSGVYFVLLHKTDVGDWQVSKLDSSKFCLAGLVIYGKKCFVVREFSFMLWTLMSSPYCYPYAYYVKDDTIIIHFFFCEQ